MLASSFIQSRILNLVSFQKTNLGEYHTKQFSFSQDYILK